MTKLRKALKSRRVTSIRQIGTDRIIEIIFSDGVFRLFLEFYAAGNIVLTDSELRIVLLQRTVTDGAPHENVHVGMTYNLDQRQNVDGVPEISDARIRAGISDFVNRSQPSADGGNTSAFKKKAAKNLNLRAALSSFLPEYPPALLEHALRAGGLETGLDPREVLAQANLFQSLIAALAVAKKTFDETPLDRGAKGFVVSKPRPGATDKPTILPSSDRPASDASVSYEEFHPFKPIQFSSEQYQTHEFDTFSDAVDHFFSSIEGSKLESRVGAQEAAAKSKIEFAQQSHMKQIHSLRQAQEINVRKAQAIELNHQMVEDAMSAVSSLLDSGMDWTNIEKFIELEQQKGNPVAKLIALPLNLKDREIKLALPETPSDDGDREFSEDDDESDGSDNDQAESSRPRQRTPPLVVAIDLSVSVFTNVRRYYTQKKDASSKEQRTAKVTDTAIKRQKAKIMSDLKQNLSQEKELLRPVRPQRWFEKFYYFFSTDGYLVIGSKDRQQTDLLCSKYLGHGDAFVHSDFDGSPVVVVKNKLANAAAVSVPPPPIPPSTLAQAGHFSISGSKAWETKAVMSGWWVPASAVSKVDLRTKEVLPAGAYELNCPKVYLPPSQLLLGMAVAFELSQESVAQKLLKRLAVANPEVCSDGVSKSRTSGSVADSDAGHASHSPRGTTPTRPDDSEPQDLADLSDSFCGDSQGGSDSDDDDDEDDDASDSDDDCFPDVALGGAESFPAASPAAPSVPDAPSQALARSEIPEPVALRDSPTSSTQNSHDDGLASVPDHEIDRLQFDPTTYTGRPTVGDVLLSAIPICAPWSSLSNYKYKVKIQPGHTKKGKAVREVFSSWAATLANPSRFDNTATDPERTWPAERQLIQAWKESEMIGVVPVGQMTVLRPEGGKGGGQGNKGGGKGSNDRAGTKGREKGDSKGKGGKKSNRKNK